MVHKICVFIYRSETISFASLIIFASVKHNQLFKCNVLFVKSYIFLIRINACQKIFKIFLVVR